MVALEIIIALVLLVIAGFLILKGKIVVEINVNVQGGFDHSRKETAVPAPLIPKSESLTELTEEERQLYEESHSLLGALNHLLNTGEMPPEHKKPEKELGNG